MNTRPLNHVLGTAAIADLLVLIRWRLGRLFRAWRHRREVAQLLHADDRMLADIGLTRLDVEGALSAPVSYDPSQLLLRSRAERRTYMRRSN